MTTPKISVVVPFYNAEPFIERCVRGLLAQNYAANRYEIIMVDNNSTDASAKTAMLSPRIRMISEKKQGSYAARNQGLRHASGEIIAFIDPDCIPDHDWLGGIAAAFADPDVGIVIGRQQFAHQKPLLSALETYEDEKNRYVFSSGIKDIYFGHTNNMAVRKEILEEVGPFVERSRGADTIFVRQCIDSYSCGVVRYCPEIQVRHMEIDSLLKYYRKVFIYAHSRRSYRHICRTRPLTNRERILILRKIIRGRGFSWIRSAITVALLTVGIFYWTLGCATAAWFSKRAAGEYGVTRIRPVPRRLNRVP